MKKYLWIFIPFLLTGCFFGDVGQGKLTETCKQTITTGPFIEQKEYTLRFQNREIYEAEIVETYRTEELPSQALKSIKETIAFKNKNLSKTIGITWEEVNNTEEIYQIHYTIDMNQYPSEYYSEFKLSKNYEDQVKILKESGMTCK